MLIRKSQLAGHASFSVGPFLSSISLQQNDRLQQPLIPKMSRPRTIQIFLPKGDPRGMRIAELTTSTVRVIEVPRALLRDFQAMPEAQQVGLYLLLGDNEVATGTAIYIGQSGAVGERLSQHNKSKDFWTRALVVISLTNNFTQTHTLFLEWWSIRAAHEAGRYQIENGNVGTKPHTPAPLQADCEDIHETVRTLIATLGHPVFDPVGKIEDGEPRDLQTRFYCKATGVDGIGEYTPEGFVVLKGSRGRMKNVNSIVGTADERFRDRLFTNGVLVQRGDAVEFTRDHLFGSPSMAAVALLGRTANGWLEWKDASGTTLHKLKRSDT
jgi:Domain of unknown function (DUF4357)